MTIPNVLTLFRLFVLPLIVIFTFYNSLIAFLLFIIAGISDVIDGIIAKRLNQATVFGAFIDPMVDKILINCMFITLLAVNVLPLYMVLLNIAREFSVQVTRDLAKSKGVILKSEISGKLKAHMQGITIAVSLLVLYLGLSVMISHILMGVTLIIAYYALIEFFWKNKDTLKKWL